MKIPFWLSVEILLQSIFEITVCGFLDFREWLLETWQGALFMLALGMLLMSMSVGLYFANSKEIIYGLNKLRSIF